MTLMVVSVSPTVLTAVSVACNGIADQSADNCTTNDSRAVAAACKSAN
jgi:hypothetical protein